jgi:circadian clock protein KaiC
MTDRLPSGSTRLDEVLGGGLPANAINLVIGPPGSGKTILAEQYLFHNATEQRPGLFLSTVSEPFDKVLRYGESLDFFDPDALGTRVFYDDLGSALVTHGIKGLVDQVDEHLRELQPGLLVIDSFKAISAFAPDEAEFRRFLHDLAGRLTAVATNAFWIGEYQRRATTEAAEFAVTDSIIAMDTKRSAEREIRVLQVLKLRGSSFRSGEHAYRIKSSGIDVFPRLADAQETTDYAGGTTRDSTGIAALDTALGDGYWEGSSTLIVGPTGVGKTLMGLHFAFSAARNGRPAILATFQENPTQLARIAASFGWTLDDPCISVLSRSPVDLYIDEWVHGLLDLIDTVGASRVVIDSLGDILLASPDQLRFRELIHSLVQRCTRRRVSLLFTYEVTELFGARRLSDTSISNLSDNVVMLQYHRTGTEVRRSLTVLKTRGSAHTPEVREFHISADGLTLGDPVDAERESASPTPG